MRVTVLGGTRFIGRAIVDELLAAGHEVQVVHRGSEEPAGLPDAPHVHADRRELVAARGELDRFSPEAVVDCMALGAADSDAVLAAFPDPGLRLVVLSSADVYRSFHALQLGIVTDDVPVTETSPVREERYPYRGRMPGMDDYEKLDVEERYLGRGGTVCRLPMVFGPHDYQRREWFVLRRVAAGRTRMPFGVGNGLLPRGSVDDIARGVRLAMEHDSARGEIFHFAERRTATVRLWAERIVAAAGADLELVRVPDDALPPDLGLTGAITQPVILDTTKARTQLGWEPGDPVAALQRSVAWHLANPPQETGDFSADDAALAQAAG